MPTSPTDLNPRRGATTAAPNHAHAPSPREALSAVLEHYFAKSRHLRSRPGYELAVTPPVQEKRAESVLTLLAKIKNDPTPGLFVFGHEALPQVGNVTWTQVITVLRDDVVRKSSKEGAKWRVVSVVPREQTIEYAVAAGRQVLDRVRRICIGTGDDPEESKNRTKRIFGGWKMGKGRPAMAAALRSVQVAIEEWGTAAPLALQLVLPDIAATLARVENSVPQAGGRPPKEQWAWADEVLESALALRLAMSSLLEHALATAKPNRHAAFQQAIDPVPPEHAAGESEDESGENEPEAEAAEEESADAAEEESADAAEEEASEPPAAAPSRTESPSG